MVNDKAAATMHPNGGRYVVNCGECGADIFRAMFYDVAERYAELHEETTGHQTDVLGELPNA